MPPFRPWIGIEQVYLGERGVGKPSQEINGVSGVKPDIVDGARVDRCKDFRHAVDEGLAANEPDRRMGSGLSNQILAAAESDFEADSFGRARKHLPEVARRRLVECELKPRQQSRNEVDLA